MSRQYQIYINERNKNKFYHLMEYKRTKPYFLETIKITVGNPINDTYHMVKNIVYKEKQILALKREKDRNNIILVEATIECGQLKCISMLSDDVLTEVIKIVESSIH